MKIAVLMGLTAIALLISIASAMAACALSDVQITGWKWRLENGYVIGLGEIMTGCVTPIGVQIQVTIRDATGSLLDVKEEWPASIRNIPPGDPYPFKTRLREVKGTAAVEVRAIDLRRWDER